jgi:DNA-directed RNA polymerase specialized sigma24 family protein
MLRNSTGADDLQLAIAIKKGNQQSLGVLYDKYAPALSGIISRITNDKKLNEKILTKAFVNAWNQITAFNSSTSSLFSWLISIARQTAFEVLKSEQEQNPGDNNSVYPAHQKSVFELVYYKGLTYNEVAMALQITVDKAKASIKMTMENMKEKTVV